MFWREEIRKSHLLKMIESSQTQSQPLAFFMDQAHTTGVLEICSPWRRACDPTAPVAHCGKRLRWESVFSKVMSGLWFLRSFLLDFNHAYIT